MAFSIVDKLERATKPLSARELAKIYGVAPKTIYRRYQDGKIPAVDLGFETLRFDPKQLLDELLARNPFMRPGYIRRSPRAGK